MTSSVATRSGLVCVTGRFQPVHLQHMELFDLALAQADHLIVAVTNPDPQARHEEATSGHRHTVAANPFTYYQRVRLLTTALDSAGHLGRTTIVPFDLTRPEVWADYVPKEALQLVRAYSDWERQKASWLSAAGYQVSVLQGDAQRRISSTDVRNGVDGWQNLVPASTIPLLRDMAAGTALSERTP